MHCSLFATAVSFNKTSFHLPMGTCQAIVFFRHDTHTKMPLWASNTFTVDNNRAVLSGKVKEKYLLQMQSNGKTGWTSVAVLRGYWSLLSVNPAAGEQGKGAKCDQGVVFLFRLKFTFFFFSNINTFYRQYIVSGSRKDILLWWLLIDFLLSITI